MQQAGDAWKLQWRRHVGVPRQRGQGDSVGMKETGCAQKVHEVHGRRVCVRVCVCVCVLEGYKGDCVYEVVNVYVSECNVHGKCV